MQKQDVVAALQAVLALFADVDAGVQSLKQERLALKAALPGAHQLMVNLKAFLVSFLGKGNPSLAAFGIVEKPRRKLTPAEKAASAAKALATRELRGTLGKRAKQRVKFTGQVEVQTVMKPSGAPIAGLTALAPGGDTGASSSTPSAK